jgi:hypothetical protein
LLPKVNRLLLEIRKAGFCFWAWNALVAWPPITEHGELWRWCGNWNAILNELENQGPRWEGARDILSLRFSDADGLSEGKVCFLNKTGLREINASCLAPSIDANLINAAGPLLSEIEPTPEQWRNCQEKLFQLQFDNWQKPDGKEEQEPLEWIPGIPPLALNRKGFFSALCRMTWKALRELEGSNRPNQPTPQDFESMHRALDTVFRWCEPYLPTGICKPKKSTSDKEELEILLWECRNAKQLINGLEYVKDRSGIPQDFQGAVRDLWITCRSHFDHCLSEKGPITDKDQALQALDEVEGALKSKQSLPAMSSGAKLEKELPEELAKKEYSALNAECKERLTNLGEWKESKEKRHEFRILMKRFDFNRFAIATKLGIPLSELPYPPEIQELAEHSAR